MSVGLPLAAVTDDPYEVGERERFRVGPSFDVQLGWETSSEAERGWSRVLETQGVIVTRLDFGAGGIRGFSLWDDRIPLIGVNSGLRSEVRSFTMFHEYAHLLIRSDEACDVAGVSAAGVERWCESFAAAFCFPLSI